MPELREFKVGMANVFLKHTSASITLNENVSHEGVVLVAFRCGAIKKKYAMLLCIDIVRRVFNVNSRRTDHDLDHPQ